MGGVAPAARDDAQGRFRAGDAVGYAGGELVAWGEPGETLAATLAQLAEGAELVTCIAGDAARRSTATAVEARAARRASSSSTTRAASPPGGACSARSDARASRSHGSRCRRAIRRADPLLSAGPSLLRASRSTAPEGARERSASRPGATCSSTSRTPTATAATCAGRRAGVGRGGDRRRGRPRRDRPADAQPAPQARRGARVRRDRPAGGGLVQPALARPPARRGHAGAAPRQAAPARRVLGDRVRAARRRGGAPVHTVGLVPVYPATEGLSAGNAARARCGEARPRMLRRRRAAARARCASAERLPDRPAALAAVALPGQRGGRAGRAPPARVRGAVPAPARGGRAAPRAPRGAPRAAARGRAACWSTAGAGRCRSS